MSLTSHRTPLALLVGVGLIAATLLAAAPQADAAAIYACKKKDDGTIRLVGKRTRCRRGEKKLKWGTRGPAGRRGANGANGVNGANGARGPAGAFNVVDQAGANVGLFAGFTFFGTAAQTTNGVVLVYDNITTTTGPSAYLPGFYYRAAGCVGTPYINYPGGLYPFGIPTILANPPAPGSQMYSPAPGTLEVNMAYQSIRTAAGCTNTASTASNAYQTRANGVVPIVQEPVLLQPLG